MAEAIANIGSTHTAYLDAREADGSIPQPQRGYPKAYLLDPDDQMLQSTVGADSGQGDGKFIALFTIPDMQLNERALFKVKWDMKCVDGSRIRDTQQLWVQPNEQVEFDDPVLLADDLDFEFYLPVLCDDKSLTLTIYEANQPVFPPIQSGTNLSTSVYDLASKVNVTMLNALPPKMAAYQAICRYKVNGKSQVMTFEIWSVTPTMLQQADYVERRLNKAKLDNVIPALQWRQCDLMMYLSSGLNRLNTGGNGLTQFTGLNMQGRLRDLHNVCATYEAVLAQRKAESDHSGNFSGQAVTFEINRIDGLNELLQSLETEINEQLPKVKDLLIRYGIRDGDGSAGDLTGMTSGAQAFVSIGQHPTVQLNRQRPFASRGLRNF